MKQQKIPVHELRSVLLYSGLIVLVMFGLSAWAWGQIPADQPVPVHWGIDGEADRYGSKFEGLLLMPIIVTAVAGLLALVPIIDPRRANLAQSQKAYKAVWVGVVSFFLVIHILLISNALGYGGRIDYAVPLFVGLLFVIIGNYMGKIRSNFMFGIRTPWTLSSDLSWDKTHRLGGKLFMLLGLALMASTLFATGALTYTVLMVGVFGMLIILFAYSYWVWKQDPHAQTG